MISSVIGSAIIYRGPTPAYRRDLDRRKLSSVVADPRPGNVARGDAGIRKRKNAGRSAAAVAGMDTASHADATAIIKQNAEKSSGEYVATAFLATLVDGVHPLMVDR